MEVIASKSSTLNACPCSKDIQGHKRVGKPGCSADNCAVAILPDDWVPKRSGPILANYLKKREQEHNIIHEDIIKSAAVANSEVNTKLRAQAECLLARINQNQMEMDCVVSKYQDTTEGALSAEARDDALKTINKLSLRRMADKASFTREATALEKERADKLKIILRENFRRLVSTGHMTPKQLLHDFDQRIFEINHQLLSNSRAFTELEANLMRGLSDSIIRAKSSLNQLTLGILVTYRERSAHSFIRQSIAESISQRRPSSVRMRDTSIGTLLLDVTELEACVSRLVDGYRLAVMSIISGFYNKMANLEKDLFSKDFSCRGLEDEFLDICNLIERPLNRLSAFYIEQCTQAVTEAEVVSLHKSLRSLGECLRDTYSLLYNAGHLWDAHILRSALAQTLTIAAVEDLLTNNDTIELANEVPISIAIEQLRTSPDADKLNQQYEVIAQMLDRTADMYLQHSEAELGRLEEFMNLPTAMTNTLLSEFDLFLEKHPRPKTVTQEIACSRLITPSRSPSSVRMPLPRAILQTELQETSLLNWRNGFLESFESNISLLPDELKHQAHLWVEERSTSLHMRYSMKMISHNVRIDRVKAILNLRLAELRHHDTRLESHLSAINHLVNNLPVEASEFASVEEPFLYPIVDWVNKVQTSINVLQAQDPPNLEVKVMKMASYGLRLPRYRNFFEESLDKAVDGYKELLEHRVHEARISNLRFLSHIKLFSEGGNYAAQEATRATLALTKVSDALESCINKSLDALKNRRSQLLAYVDNNYIVPLMRIVEDAGKLLPKSSAGKQMDKKKPKK